MQQFIALALRLTAHVYGLSEPFCGSPAFPVLCDSHAVTSSGILLDPSIPTAAIPLPAGLQFEPFIINVRLVRGNGTCVGIWVVDKVAAKHVGRRGFDLTPAAVEALGGVVSKSWSGRLEEC